MKTEIKNEWNYDQSPKEVWQYLTRPELIAQWLMPNDFKPEAGQEFRFTAKPIPSLDLDGIFHCKVVEIQPFSKLTYTWKGGPGNGVFTLDTLVEWTLEKKGNGTKLSIRQSGFKETNVSIFDAMTSGWNSNALKMGKLLNEANHGSAKV